MTKFQNSLQYFVFLRGVGNPDFSQYSDVAPPCFAIVENMEEAIHQCQHYISMWDLGSGNWGGTHPGDTARSGNVFDLDGKLVARISYNGRVSEAESEVYCPSTLWKVQFRSWNKWQTNRLEAALKESGAEYVNTEDWTGGDYDPAVITFCEIRNKTVNQIVAIASSVSPYIHLGHIE